MKASETPLFKLLQGQICFVMPLFQRPYTWDKSNWETLLQDIDDIYDNSADQMNAHFMGSTVTKVLDASPEGVSRFLVIDGQQRLTTLTILLAALRDKANNIDPPLADKIHRLYLTNEFGDGFDKYKVLPTQSDREAYSALIERKPEEASDSRIGRAYKYFFDGLSNLDENGESVQVTKMEQLITRYLELVNISLDRDDNEYRIFESLNAKGEALTQADLLRNYFFMRIPVSQQDEVYDKIWLPIEQRLGKDSKKLEDFFRYEYMSDGEFVRQDNVYQAWKKRFDELKTPQQLIDQLQVLAHRSTFYQKLINPTHEPDAKIRAGLDWLNRWGSQTIYPFLLFVYRKYDVGDVTPAGFVQILNTLQSYLVRRLFARVPTNALNRLFLRLSQQLPSGLDIASGTQAVLSEQSRRWPGDKDFLEGILSFPLYNEGQAEQRRLILETLELQHPHKEKPSLTKLQIEHVMPQTLTDEWRAELGADADEVHSQLLHTLGNLTLTGYNQEMSNNPYQVKWQELAKSNLNMNRDIAKEEHWTAEQIRKRAERLGQLALKIWPGPNALEQPHTK